MRERYGRKVRVVNIKINQRGSPLPRQPRHLTQSFDIAHRLCPIATQKAATCASNQAVRARGKNYRADDRPRYSCVYF